MLKTSKNHSSHLSSKNNSENLKQHNSDVMIIMPLTAPPTPVHLCHPPLHAKRLCTRAHHCNVVAPKSVGTVLAHPKTRTKNI